MGKIRQPAAVIEVHVGEDDVLEVFGLVTQPLDLIHSRFLRIERHDGDDTKELREPCGMCVILNPQPRINKCQSLIRFEQQADRARLPPTRYARVACKAVENFNFH